MDSITEFVYSEIQHDKNKNCFVEFKRYYEMKYKESPSGVIYVLGFNDKLDNSWQQVLLYKKEIYDTFANDLDRKILLDCDFLTQLCCCNYDR